MDEIKEKILSEITEKTLEEIKNERKREKRRNKNKRYRKNSRNRKDEELVCHYKSSKYTSCTNENRIRCHHVISNEIDTNNLTNHQ